MIDLIKRFFDKSAASEKDDAVKGSQHDIRVAVCALFVEMARIDESFTQDELDGLIEILKGRFSLDSENADALITEADAELEESVDLWQFADLINKNYSNEEKIEVIETLWQIVYIDGRMDKHENYLMHKLQSLLRLDHPQLIAAKKKALGQL